MLIAPLSPLVESFSVTIRMAAPLSVCTKEEQRGVIYFLLSEDVTGAEIHRGLSAQYGDSALPWRSVYEWIERFQHGRTSVKDEERAGRPCHDSGKPTSGY